MVSCAGETDTFALLLLTTYVFPERIAVLRKLTREVPTAVAVPLVLQWSNRSLLTRRSLFLIPRPLATSTLHLTVAIIFLGLATLREQALRTWAPLTLVLKLQPVSSPLATLLFDPPRQLNSKLLSLELFLFAMVLVTVDVKLQVAPPSSRSALLFLLTLQGRLLLPPRRVPKKPRHSRVQTEQYRSLPLRALTLGRSRMSTRHSRLRKETLGHATLVRRSLVHRLVILRLLARELRPLNTLLGS